MSEDGVAYESLISCFHYSIWTPIAILTANQMGSIVQTFYTAQIQIRIQNPIIFLMYIQICSYLKLLVKVHLR